MIGVSRERSETDADGHIRHGDKNHHTDPRAATWYVHGGTCSANPLNDAHVAFHSALQEYQRRLVLRALIRLHGACNTVELDQHCTLFLHALEGPSRGSP